MKWKSNFDEDYVRLGQNPRISRTSGEHSVKRLKRKVMERHRIRREQIRNKKGASVKNHIRWLCKRCGVAKMRGAHI